MLLFVLSLIGWYVGRDLVAALMVIVSLILIGLSSMNSKEEGEDIGEEG